MELDIKFVNGKFRTYAEVRSPIGYCFYDAEAEERNYLEYIASPILNEEKLKRKFVLVEGDAEKLNEELSEKSNEIE